MSSRATATFPMSDTNTQSHHTLEAFLIGDLPLLGRDPGLRRVRGLSAIYRASGRARLRDAFPTQGRTNPAASSGSPYFSLPHSLGGMWRCMNAQTRGHCRAWMHTTGIAAGADLPWASPSSVMGASDSNSALTSTPCGMCMRYWGTPSRGHLHGYSPDPMIGIRTGTHQDFCHPIFYLKEFQSDSGNII